MSLEVTSWIGYREWTSQYTHIARGRNSHAVICRFPYSNSNTCKSESTCEGSRVVLMKIPFVVPPEVSWVKIVWEETTPRSAVIGNEFWNFIVIATAVWNQNRMERRRRKACRSCYICKFSGKLKLDAEQSFNRWTLIPPTGLLALHQKIYWDGVTKFCLETRHD